MELFNKGDIIAYYGDKLKNLYFLIYGRIRFTCITNNYEEYAFFDASNDGLFGEVEYLTGLPLITQYKVVEDSVCIVIPVQPNKEILDQDIKFQRFVGVVLALKYNNLRSQYMDVETYSLRIRLARYLAGREEGQKLPDLKSLSIVLRCSYRNLIRQLNQFCEERLIRHLDRKGKYVLADKEGVLKILQGAGIETISQ